MIGFWHWLAKGHGSKPGFRRFFDRWLLAHFAVGFLFSYFLPIPIQQAASTLLLPVAGVFVGLAFAWGGNAQALLQTVEIEDFCNYREGGYEDYLYTFQLAIFVILATIVLWAIAGLGIFDAVWPRASSEPQYKFIVMCLFFMSSITVRECWHVVLGAQYLLLVRYKIRQEK